MNHIYGSAFSDIISTVNSKEKRNLKNLDEDGKINMIINMIKLINMIIVNNNIIK